ncbi:MAG: MerR family transcriptional regulator [Acidobacteriota bacterium]
MNITFSIDDQTGQRARERAMAMGKSLNQAVREYLRHLAGEDQDVEREIEEFERLSGLGNSKGWKFNRDEIHERR